MKAIIFDQNSYRWEGVRELDLASLETCCQSLKLRFKAYGYLYLNQVYECLGTKWDSNDENVCYKKENGPIKFTHEETDFGTYRILITQ